MAAQESITAKFLLITDGVHYPQKKALATRSPYSLPKYMYLDLPRDVIIRSVARFRLRVHTLRSETATWSPRSPPTCDLCEADDDVQDEQHAIFHCTHPHPVSLRRRYESLFSRQEHRTSLHFCTRTTTNLFYLIVFMSRLAVARFD